MINDLIKKRKMYVSKQEMILVIESANDKILNDENLKNIKPEIEKLKQNKKNNEKRYSSRELSSCSIQGYV
jgi:predicted double-glycine peptidase